MLTNLARRQISVNSNPANSNSATTIDHKKWPLVSVIIPVFNRESTITRAIASVQRQTYKNIQILVIDDGSSDATVDVVRRLTERDQRVTLLRHSSNQGRSAARNTGVRVASGELVAFCGPPASRDVHPGLVSRRLAAGVHEVDENDREDWTYDFGGGVFYLLHLARGIVESVESLPR